MIRRRILPLFFLFVLALSVALVWAQDALPPEATLGSVAHSHSVRGGDLSEALGFPRAMDKQKPLVEMGVTPAQLQAALEKLCATPQPAVAGRTKANLSMTIRQVAAMYEINGIALTHDLGLDVEVDKDTPLAALGVTQETLDKAIAHNLSHEESGWQYLKYLLYPLLVLFAMLYLLKFGIPKNADPKKRRHYYPRKVYVIALLVALIVLGFVLGKSPNPMEGAVKFFKATVGLYDSVPPKLLLMIYFLALAWIANKVVCGWACPFGALEELIYLLPLFNKAKKRQVPFWVSNGFRIAFFIFFLLTLYGLVGNRKGVVYYHLVNPFNLFNFDFSTWTVPVALAVYLVASFFFYRPYCRFICPFGLLSWLVERISLSRVRIDFDRCIDCRACAKACPLSAAADRLDKKKLPADCFACMRCLRVCPTDAIHFRPAWGPPSPPAKDAPDKAVSS